MNYTLIRHEKTSRKEQDYKYSVLQIPELQARTNYRRNSESLIWTVEYNDKLVLKQVYSPWRCTINIPLLGLILSSYNDRKYEIYRNEKCVGYNDRYKMDGRKWKVERYVIDKKEYIVNPGNMNVIRPFKTYEWSIENRNGDVIADIKNPKGDSNVYINIPKDEDVEIVIAIVMMWEIACFGPETSVSSLP